MIRRCALFVAALAGLSWWRRRNAPVSFRNLANQESPISKLEKPLLLLDLWEHAYYLKWQNRRPEWIETFWSLVDWDRVEALYVEEPAWMAEHLSR